MENEEKIRIKWLTEDDWLIYKKIRLEAITRVPSAFGTAYEEEVEHPESVWRERTPNCLFAFVGETSVGLIGHIRLTRIKQKHIVHIVSFYVKEEYRGRGIGKALLEGIMERIRGYSGVEKVALSVSSTQVPALRLYEKYGFEVMGKQLKELKIDGAYYDLLSMEYFL